MVGGKETISELVCEGDQDTQGERKGTIAFLYYSHLGPVTSNTFLKSCEVINNTWAPGKTGSVIGIAVVYDLQAVGTPGTAPTFTVRVSGSSVLSVSTDTTIANAKKARTTQARGTDTFTSSQDIECVLLNSLGHTYAKMIAIVAVLLDG